MSVFQHQSLDYLLLAQREALLTDFDIVFNETSVSCHKAIVSQSSQRLQKLIHKNQNDYDLPEFDDATIDDLTNLVRCFYGQSLDITTPNALPLYFLSKSLSCTELATICKSVSANSSPKTHQIPSSTILKNLQNDEFKDHQIIFHDQSINIHKFLFASMSRYFKAKFTRNWQESEDTTTDFSKLLQVSPSSFFNFFTSFYDGKLEVNLENAFDHSHLAWYFQLSELEKFVQNFIENSVSEYNWVTALVLKAIKSEDFRFIRIISAKISEIQDLSNCNPIAVHPLFFENLTSNIDISWLLKCLVFSYSSYSKDNVWTPQSLEKSIETIKIDSLPVDEVYQIIEPLFSISDLFEFLSTFSISIFSKFTSQVPLYWFTWFLAESDLRREFNLISQVSPFLNEMITPENIDQIQINSFHSETLNLFALETKKEHLIIWILNCLIELWSSSKLKVSDFSRILMALNLEESNVDLIYSTLGKLISDEILKPILFEFVSIKLVPRMVKESHEEKKILRGEISELQRINGQQEKINGQQEKKISELERINGQQGKKISELEKTNGEQQKINGEQQTSINELKNELDELKSIIQSIIQQQQAQELKLKQEREAKEAELKRQEEERLEYERNRPKFLSTNKGSKITLSENDLVATKTSGNCWDNSFIKINHPVKGKVVLTLLEIGSNFYTYIGLFDPSHCQTGSCMSYAQALFVWNGYTQFRVNDSYTGPRSGGISKNQQVIIEFNNNQVTFSVPSLGYSHSITWPSGYVFGLVTCYQNTLWKVSDS
ncbi:hypothetical protein RCL1_004823 [Eukaryota sp. TZLM3-RCL]